MKTIGPAKNGSGTRNSAKSSSWVGELKKSVNRIDRKEKKKLYGKEEEWNLL